MAPHVSFIVNNRSGDPVTAVWEALERQDLPPNEIEIHILSGAGGATPTLPEIRGRVVVFLGDQMIPAPDLARRAWAYLQETDDPGSSVLVGRVLEHETSGRNPVARRLATGIWTAFERILDPDRLPLDQFHARCLSMTAERFAASRETFLDFVQDAVPDDTRLAIALTDGGSTRLRFRTGLLVQHGRTLTLDDAIEILRGRAREAYRAADRGVTTATTLAIPTRDTLMAADATALEARLERLRIVGSEAAKLDLMAIATAEQMDAGVADRIVLATDSLLRNVRDVTWRLGCVDAIAGTSSTSTDDAAAVTTIPLSAANGASTVEPSATTPPATTPPATTPPATTPPAPESPSTIVVSAVSNEPRENRLDPALAATLVLFSNDTDALAPCLDAIAALTPEPHEIIVIDASPSATAGDIVGAHRSVRAVHAIPEGTGYGVAVNEAIRDRLGEHVVLIGADVVPTPGWLTALLSKLQPDVGAVGPISNGLLGAQNVITHVDDIATLRDPQRLLDHLHRRGSEPIPVSYLQAPCLALSRETIERVGPLDDRFWTADVAFLELTWRLGRENLRMLVAADAFVARPDGLRHPVGPRGCRDRFDADMQTLRRLVAEAGHESATSAEIWGVAWTGFDDPATDGGRTPDVSVVIPVLNQIDCTRECLETLRASSTSDIEIIVFDNGSTDGTREYLDACTDVKVIHSDTNLGFAPAVNRALDASRGRNVLILNNDVIVPHRMIERLSAGLTANPDFGVIGPVTNESADSQRVTVDYTDVSGIEQFADERWTNHGPGLRNEAAVLGFAMLVRREVLDTIGGFDEQFEIGNFEDNDFSLRAQVAGFRVGVADGVFIHHHGSRTFVGEGFDYAELMSANHARFESKWNADIAAGSAERNLPAAGDTLTPSPRLVPAAAPLEPASSDAAPVIRRAYEPPPLRLVEAPPTSATAPGWIPLNADEEVGSGAPGDPAPSSNEYEFPTRVTTDGSGDPSHDVSAGPLEFADDPDISDELRDMKLDDAAPGVIYLVANDRLEKGQHDEAIELFRIAIERMPDMSLAHMGLGLAYARSGQPLEAATSLEVCVRLAPDLSEAHNNLGVVYHLLGRQEEARQALERATQLDPENESARTNLEGILG